MTIKEILSGHVSQETAYVVDDYPYGFRLRCKIRYWLDCDVKKGARLVSQTTNPKMRHLGNMDVWNKPKASTYCRFGGCMYLDENDHVQWAGLHEYMDGKEISAWRDTYGAGVPATLAPIMNEWVAAKVAYDKAREEGKSVPEAMQASRAARQ